MPKYYVEFEGGQSTIVEAKRKATADRYARWEFGNTYVKFTRLATKEEIAWNTAMGGRTHSATE